MIELIGTNAGLVWNVLNEGGKMSFILIFLPISHILHYHTQD